MELFANITMREAVLFCIFLIRCNALKAINEQASAFVPILNDTLDDNDLNLPPDLNTSLVLRYGHHQVLECHDFKKAYVCIMKCLELGFHIAQANKKCKCVCFKDYVKGKYFPNVTVGWKVPTTSLPSWAEKFVEEASPQLKTSFEDYGDDDDDDELEGKNTASNDTYVEKSHEEEEPVAKDDSKSKEEEHSYEGTIDKSDKSTKEETKEEGTVEKETKEDGSKEETKEGTQEEGTKEERTKEEEAEEEHTKTEESGEEEHE